MISFLGTVWVTIIIKTKKTPTNSEFKWLSLRCDFLSWRNHDWQVLADGRIYIPHPNLCLQMETKMFFSRNCFTTDFTCCSNKPLCNDSAQAGKIYIYIYIFITFPATWTVKTFILLLFGCKTLFVPSLSAAPDQTKMLNMLKRISAEHQHVGPVSADGGWKRQHLHTLLCLKPVEITAVTKVG